MAIGKEIIGYLKLQLINYYKRTLTILKDELIKFTSKEAKKLVLKVKHSG